MYHIYYLDFHGKKKHSPHGVISKTLYFILFDLYYIDMMKLTKKQNIDGRKIL